MRWHELTVVAIALAAAVPAHAEPEIYLRTAVPEARGQPPRVVATVVGGPEGTTADRWSLAQVDRKPPAVVQASAVRRYRETAEPIAIVVLVEAHFLFIGNTTDETPDGRFDGIHRHLEPVVAALRSMAPPGSLGAVVTYDKGATVRREMAPIAESFDETAFGTERDYTGRLTRDLVTGVNLSMELLREVTAPRKALVVITDGADTNVDAARQQLALMRRLAEQDGIELYGIGYSAGIGDELTAIKSLIPDIRVAASPEGLPPLGMATADQISDRYQIEFPGKGLAWDGCEHEVQLQLDGAPFGDTLFLGALPHGCRPARPARASWPYIVAGVVVGGTGMGLVLVLMRRRRRSLHR